MAQLVGNDEIEPSRIELAETGKSLRSSFRCHTSSFRNSSGVDVECASQWAEIDRLPTFERLRSSLIDEHNGSSKVDIQGKRVIDVTKLGAQERHMLVEKLIKHVEDDNLQLLQKMRRRIDKVGVELPTVVVRYNDLRVEAMCEVVRGKPLPTLWNSLKRLLLDCTMLIGLKSQEAKINIIDDFNGIIKPGRMTLLLGPPGCGKTTLLKALSGNLDKSLKVAGEVFYNGHKLEEFIPQKTSAYVSQNDLHIPELTVREALDFSARCQGVGTRAEIMAEVVKREKQARVVPDPDIDTYMKDYKHTMIVKSLLFFARRLEQLALRFPITLSNFSDGVSASRGEIIIGPTRALFMDEITNGLDSSTTYQIVASLQHLAHITDATILVALLQPAPETFDLFDDIILMAEGKIVYHGPRSHVLEFFEDCGFRCPKRKGVADFLQEVISRKDQAQYWHQAEQSWSYISVDMFSKKFKESTYGKKIDAELSQPFIKCCHKNASSFGMYSLSKWALFRACMSREWLLMRRNSFVYVFRLIQLVITASISMTVFLRNGAGIDVIHANRYLGASFYAIVVLFFDGMPELSMTVARLPIFYKQRDLCFYPAWSYAISSAILKVPLSLLAGLIWTSLTYYVIGYSPEPGRFFGQFMLLFSVHFVAISLFRFLASVFRTMDASSASASFAILFDFLFAGFIIRKTSMPTWLKWGFWVFPLSYGEVGLAVNEFLAPRWQTKLAGNTTIGDETLENRGLQFSGYFFWISLGALLGFAILFNIGFALALTFLNSPQSRAIISNEKVTQTERSEDSSNGSKKEAKLKSYKKTTSKPQKDRVVLPFEPLTLSFEDVQYYVETPLKKLQLLCDITGAIRPGVLTALMGITGAGKTTLLDVLAGRKTIGTIQGDIRIGGHPKLILLKTGGRIIYSGPLGQHSSNVIKYFEDIPGVPTIKSNYNPATWMLEVTSTSAEAGLGIDFSQVYKNSVLYKNNQALVNSLRIPPDSKELHFATCFPQNGWGQFKSCLWKQHLSYWRSPSYIFNRYMYSLIASLLYGILFWDQGRKMDNQQNLFNVLGAAFSVAFPLGIYNCKSVLPYVSTERSVLYRERFAGMYNSWAYPLAQVIP
ncbi:hypothetical protein RHGRI_031998 [Rhododendron griersonianum]|uniref:ABC transporter domain-containing protein n=1 Tax=Rhododendron griersonianum TaxID=479676 RepID=A0AAV6ICJ9_9ERIC|nr:hypothetical protein RHGRI_031998 [Rhododendron griersonianum]